MTEDNVRTGGSRELEIDEALRRITACTNDLTELSVDSSRNERLRQELAHDLLADACALAYAAAKARIDHFDADDVYLRREALEEAVTGFEEVVRDATRAIERLKQPPRPTTRPIAELASSESFRARVNRLPLCTAAIA